jgi:hypothetical protein
MFPSQLKKIQPSINSRNQNIWAYLAEEMTQRRSRTVLAAKRAATSRIIHVGGRDRLAMQSNSSGKETSNAPE